MRKTVSLILAILMGLQFLGYSAYAMPQALQGAYSLSTDRSYTYSTAAADSYNSIDFEIIGNIIKVRRRAYKLYGKPDVVKVMQGLSARIEREAYWSAVAGQLTSYGYEISLDVSSLYNGSYTILVETRDTFVNEMAEVSFVKDQGGCYFPKDASIPKQYNNAVMERLAGSSVPDDFGELKAMYDTAENAATLSSIQAKSLELTAGYSSGRDKALAIYKWIVENIAYDMDASGDDFYSWVERYPADEVRLDNPLHTFNQRYGLCYGFARLAVLMMGYAGVDCVYITGRVSSSPTVSLISETDLSQIPDTMNHAWNAVKVNGAWYFVDPSKDAVNYYYRSIKDQATSGYRKTSRDTIYRHLFPSLNYLSKTHMALRLGVKNKGTKLSAAPIADGWVSQNGNTYYYVDGVRLVNQQQNIGGSVYYFDAAGAVAKGWKQVDGYWRYFDDTGAMLTGQQEIQDGSEKRVYQFDASGCVTANNEWVTFGGAVRYYTGREMLTGWQYLNGYWRYFDDEGAIYLDAENPLVLPEGEFRFNDQGALQLEGSGWVRFGGERHYFDGTEMRTGLQRIGASSYLFSASGVLLTGWNTVDGKTYYSREDGTLLTGWQFIDDSWYYIDQNEGRFTGVRSAGGADHYFDAQGRLSTGGWVNLGNAYLYFADSTLKKGVQRDGKMLTGWKKVDGELRFFDRTDGRMYTGKERMYNENNQKWYTFAGNGVATVAE